jgi:predicted O-methyltransferase YrrM
MTMTDHPALHEDVLELQRDPDPRVRAVAAAVSRTVADRLDPGERGWVGAIEALRTRLEASSETIDTALPYKTATTKPMVLGDVAVRRSKKGLAALLLLLLGRELRPRQILELGSCLGLSGAYLAAATRLNGTGRLTTLEGAPALAARAEAHLDELGLAHSEVVAGLFRDTLQPVLDRVGPVDLAFVDGHHDEDATQAYFEQLLPHLAERSVVVFDDVAWSDGMVRAWEALRGHGAVRVSIDLDLIGICVAGPGDGSLRVDLPRLTAMASVAPPVPAAPPARPAEPDDVDGLFDALPVARLNWGCGRRGEPGWLNSDIKPGPRVQLVGDGRGGLPLPDGCLDYAVSVHALQETPLRELVPTLGELRRVLKPGGVLRLCLPDLERGVAAWQRGDRDYFLVPDDDAATLSGKLVTQLLWYGHSVSLFTAEWIEELLHRAGFARVRHCAYRQTASPHAEIVDLDNREAESLFVEAVR